MKLIISNWIPLSAICEIMDMNYASLESWFRTLLMLTDSPSKSPVSYVYHT